MLHMRHTEEWASCEWTAEIKQKPAMCDMTMWYHAPNTADAGGRGRAVPPSPPPAFEIFPRGGGGGLTVTFLLITGGCVVLSCSLSAGAPC